MIEFPRKKNELEILEDMVRSGEKEARTKLDKLATKNGLTFHNVEHTEGVVARYRNILDKFKSYGIEISDREAAIGEVGCWFHDVVQDYVIDKKEEAFEYKGQNHTFEVIRRKRKLGNNEEESALAAINFLHEKFGSRLNPSDEQLIMNQIMSTVPKFDPDKIVVQERLGNESRHIDFALALADLGTSGMQPGEFIADGDKLFMEDNLDIGMAIAGLPEVEIDEAKQEFYKQRMLKWSESQCKFPAKRREQVRIELAKIEVFASDPRKLEQCMNELFPGFDTAADLMSCRLKDRKEMSFQKLAKDMGYMIPSSKN